MNPREFDWISKFPRKIKSKNVQSILRKNGRIRLSLFIKKNNNKGTDFYFMGDMEPQLENVAQTLMNSNRGKKPSVVKFVLI
jgi:hypothetical protein